MEAELAPQLPDYAIRRSARAKRSRITITEAGETVVVLPARADSREAHELVLRHRRWVDRHLAQIAARQARLASRPPLGRGREIRLHGVPHRVVSLAAIDARARTSIRVADGRIVVVTALGDRRPIGRLLESWLRTKARTAIGRHVTVRGTELSISPSRVAIRDQRTRWGSASRRGTLSFSWRLVMCPPEVLDYVVVHELAHLYVAGHSGSFWRLVDRHVADSPAARRWLREHHDELRHALG